MIEIARVEPKKIQRKLLTEEQKKAICKYQTCTICKMAFQCGGITYSCRDVKEFEETFRNYWNEEVEVDL